MHCRRAVASLSTSFRQDFTSSWVDGGVDFLREALMVLVDEIMDAEVSAQVGAEYGERTPDPVTHRNGYWWLTRSSWLTCPHRNLRKKVLRVDGSLIMQPRTPTGTQRIGGVNAVAASQRGSDQRQPLVPYVGTARHAAEEDVIVDQFLQAQVLGEGGRKEQSGIGHQVVVVKDDADLEGLFPRSSFGRFGISCQLPPFDR